MRRVFFDDHGGIQIALSVMMTVLLGGAAVGMDATHWLAERQATLKMADAAASAGAYAAVDGGACDSHNVRTAAVAAAVSQGYVAGGSGNMLTVACASPMPEKTAEGSRVEVNVRRHVPSFLAGLFAIPALMPVEAQAIGTSRDRNHVCAVTLGALATAAKPSQTPDARSVSPSVSSMCTADAVRGRLEQASFVDTLATTAIGFPHPRLVEAFFPAGRQQPSRFPDTLDTVPDPYASWRLPVPLGCVSVPSVSVMAGKTLSLDAGGDCMVIRGGIAVKGALTLEAGIYYVDDGDVTIHSGAVLSGRDVAIVLTNRTGERAGRLTVHDRSTVRMQAPRSGPFSGFLFVQDDAGGVSGGAALSGSGRMNLSGAIYFPGAAIDVSGPFPPHEIQGNTRLVGKTIALSGPSSVDHRSRHCDSMTGSDPT